MQPQPYVNALNRGARHQGRFGSSGEGLAFTR